MFRHPFQRFASTAPRLRPGSHRRRLSCIEDLEPRLLLAGSPTIYTVDVLSDTGTGTGTTGDLPYCIDQANRNPNTAGSIIEFAPLLFNVPRTITVSLELSNTAGPIAVIGPGSVAVDIERRRLRAGPRRDARRDGNDLGPDYQRRTRDVRT